MPEAAVSAAPARSVSQLTDHLFRQEAGKLVSMLTGIFGIDRLQMAEDVVQEALVRALQTWPYYGIPQNPAAWLMQTAKHLALDIVRREKNFHEKEDAIVTTIEQRLSDPGESDGPHFDDEIKDGPLRLIFACCHPLIPPEAQTALALKTLCGFSPAEIAKAFLTTDVAVAKRLTRARQRIQEQHIPFAIPAGEELTTRLEGVHQILYLLFNEGYKASSGDTLVRADLCYEATRLTTLLANHPATSHPNTKALLALMLLNAARLPARMDVEGNMVRLEEQDRSKWDRGLIALGICHLAEAAVGDDLSEYHLQAGIAACHSTAADFASTDWLRILTHYDRWCTINRSPVVALNRAVAVAQVHGPKAGIEAVEAIDDRSRLDPYYLAHAVLGELESQQRHYPAAATHFRRALKLTEVKSEQVFIARRLRECEAQ